MRTIASSPKPPSGDPTPINERISIIRSLVGHRRPSQHLCELIKLAADGADWSVIAEADAEARR